MVSDKIVVVFLVLAILMSFLSIVITLSVMNNNMVPQINVNSGASADSSGGKISIIIVPGAQEEK